MRKDRYKQSSFGHRAAVQTSGSFSKHSVEIVVSWKKWKFYADLVSKATYFEPHNEREDQYYNYLELYDVYNLL
jgi:hypothetical protein